MSIAKRTKHKTTMGDDEVVKFMGIYKRSIRRVSKVFDGKEVRVEGQGTGELIEI